MGHHQGTIDAINGIYSKMGKDRKTLSRLNYLEWKCEIITWNEYQKERARIKRECG